MISKIVFLRNWMINVLICINLKNQLYKDEKRIACSMSKPVGKRLVAKENITKEHKRKLLKGSPKLTKKDREYL